MLKFAENCSDDEVSYICPSIYYQFFSIPMLALETGCFSEHINILRAFTKLLHVIAKSSISEG